MEIRRSLLPFALGLTLVLASCGSDDGPTAPNPPNPPPGPNPTFDSGNLTVGQVFVFTFADSGTFTYRCVPHTAQGMTGTVVVSAAGQDSPVVNITNNVFTPATVNVRTGSYVKWTNSQGVHTVTRP